MSVKELFKVILDKNKDFPIRTIHRTPIGILPKPVALSIVQYEMKMTKDFICFIWMRPVRNKRILIMTH